MKGLLALGQLGKGDVFLGETGKGLGNIRESFNKPSVKAGKAKERLYISKVRRDLPVPNGHNHLRVHLESGGRHNEAKVSDFLDVELGLGDVGLEAGSFKP